MNKSGYPHLGSELIYQGESQLSVKSVAAAFLKY